MEGRNQIVLYAVAIALFVGILSLLENRGERTSSSLAPKVRDDIQSRIQNKINLELKQTDLKSEIKIREIENENEVGQAINNRLNDITVETVRPELPSRVNVLEFEQENPGQRVLNDTQYEKRKLRPLTPEQRINTKLERDAWVREQEKAEQEAVVKQFINNARENGVDVRLNKNLDVIGISPRTNDQPIRILQSEPDSQSAPTNTRPPESE